MLGWDVIVYRLASPKPEVAPWTAAVARWETGVFGLEWLDTLVKEGKAECRGSGGYPSNYRITAALLFAILKQGIPGNSSPLVIGEDYTLPAGWNGQLHVNAELAAQCAPDDWLDLEIWDMS